VAGEADAERFSAVVKALTGREPKVYRMKNGEMMIVCGRAHLEGFKRYAELTDAVEKWLEETSRRQPLTQRSNAVYTALCVLSQVGSLDRKA